MKYFFKVASRESVEERGPVQESSNEAARPRNAEKNGDAENSNYQLEKTMNNHTEKEESASPP